MKHKTDSLEEADLYLRKVRKIQRCLNTIKANHAFSNKEEQLDIERLERVGATKGEIELIQKGWDARRKLTDKGITCLERYFKDGDSDSGKG